MAPRAARSGVPALLAFTSVAGASQMLWLNFAPLLGLVQQRYGVSELAASTLVLVFPLLYVVLSLPAGARIDRLGYRRVVAEGAALQALCAGARLFDDSFLVLLAAQVGIAVAQPFLMNAVSKLVSDWFDEAHGGLATGVATIGMFLGMATALAATPALVDAFSLRLAMGVFAALSAAAWLAFLVFGHERGGLPTGEAAPDAGGLRRVLGRDLALVLAMAFLGLGYFNGLTTWLELVVAENGIDAVRAGVLGGVLILGGIAGAAVIPALSDRLRRRKPFVIACSVGALATTWPLCSGRDYPTLLALAGLLGFSFLPAYALLLEMCVELSGRRRAGLATAALMMFGNAGGVVVIVAMQLVKGDGGSFRPSVALLVALLVLAIGLAMRVRETFHEREAPLVAAPRSTARRVQRLSAGARDGDRARTPRVSRA